MYEKYTTWAETTYIVDLITVFYDILSTGIGREGTVTKVHWRESKWDLR